MKSAELKEFLDDAFNKYHKISFIKDDPILIPHQFTLKQDIEIMAFLAATIAWGNRKSIINSANKLVDLMDGSPYKFILNHSNSDLKPFEKFVHRTFQATDILYFIHRLKLHYSKHDTLEQMFLSNNMEEEKDTELALKRFHNHFFDNEHAPHRTRKHVSTPERKSACKRLNMFLRWMVRTDSEVDFGLWSNIKPHQLILPLDVHVQRVAFHLKLLKRKQSDWKAAVELTENLRRLDSNDPCKYDYALFGLGVEGLI